MLKSSVILSPITVYQLWVYDSFDHQKEVSEQAMADEDWRETGGPVMIGYIIIIVWVELLLLLIIV